MSVPNPDSLDVSFVENFQFEKVKYKEVCVPIPEEHENICKEVMDICAEIYDVVCNNSVIEYPGWFVAGGFAAYIDYETNYYDDINLYIIGSGDFSPAGCKFAYKGHFFSVMLLNTCLWWDHANILPSFDSNISRRAIYSRETMYMYRLRCDKSEEMEYERVMKYIIRMRVDPRDTRKQVHTWAEEETTILNRRILFMIFDKDGRVHKTVENAMLQNHISEHLDVTLTENSPFPPQYFGFANYYRDFIHIVGKYSFEDPRLPSLRELKEVYRRAPTLI